MIFYMKKILEVKKVNIYIVTIMGNRFYFYGELSEEECEIVQILCKKISSGSKETDAEELLKIFQNSLDSSLSKKIELAKVKYVFRI